MVVLVLSACPAGLRGHLTRWLLEISAGVFVGHVSARVRDLMWLNVCEMASGGRALMVFSVPGEQRMDFRVHNHHWTPTDFDGLTLMMRPEHAAAPAVTEEPPAAGWSAASKRRKYGRRPVR
ncbi:type I-E CRISPR-associated endoribonuclease Cas2 [Geodermatophilus sp. DF01-2]|uniref:type I-E CRISPR-associated endoribonuclease Cas2e n=1 Tax=Geodermatophilus sp. DF01-2 TaxID=2559610 RepID=UPI001073CB8E|nr:type I-E CRISPR-associated endoribonuclease Cas2e [Geodermatophilus sp. DF01_2]TFV58349.1 type I-E CRISPR-associated endoribonuclease Cas2 [Geodermatophilus sp. DF01_2]